MMGMKPEVSKNVDRSKSPKIILREW